jgi:hydrogenase maturation protease
LSAELAGEPDVSIREFTGSPLDLISELGEVERLILIDSVATGTRPQGTVYLFTREELLDTHNGLRPHGLNIREALALATRMGIEMPRSISLVGVEVGEINSFGTEMSDELAASLPAIHRRVAELVNQLLADSPPYTNTSG